MKSDSFYKSQFRLSEKEHRYGSFVHLLDDPYVLQVLNKFSTSQIKQPEANQMVRSLYSFLMRQMLNHLLPKASETVSTRMSAAHPEAKFESPCFDRSSRIVFVDLMRAGILPTQTCFEIAHDVLPPENLRQDHILLNRKTNEKGEVVGVNISGHKIGGPIDESYVVIADPMGATGGSLVSTIELLKKTAQKSKPAKKFIGLHLIVTPEFLKAAKKLESELEIFALRLDRGLSSPAVLNSIPGTHWDDERGLNPHDYIVPGAGGIGEILNNSFV